MEKIVVGIGDGKLAQEGQQLVSYALGSCVGVCLYDRVKKLAGMAHVVLPDARLGEGSAGGYRYALQGTRNLICRMQQAGADKRRLTAKIAGGARMFSSVNGQWDIGSQNIEMVRKTLAQEGIRLVAEDTGKDYGRTVLFSADDGRMEISTVRHKPLIL